MAKETNIDTLSTEELVELKATRVKFMSDALSDLRIQDEYTRLRANISENNLRDYMSKIKLASLQLPPEKEDTKSEKK